ncbi:MAG: glutathione S-transferase family protein [Methylococcaceae bacterium]|nr:glutathione S-transferase family protein [Methylococcaceae bacterium]
MIKLHQFSSHFGLPNASPFCMKMENYLRMSGLDFEVVDDFDPRKAPKGKMPYIEDGDIKVADSGLIIEYLKTTYGDSLDAHLSAEEKAVSLAFTRLLDEHLYWALVHVRWIDAEGWKITRDRYFQAVPTPLRGIIAYLSLRGARKQIWGHGMGRHSPEEIEALAKADISALSDYLGDKPFFMGENPTTLDAVAYAHLANILWVPYEGAIKRHTSALPNLEAYCLRMKARYYPNSA